MKKIALVLVVLSIAGAGCVQSFDVVEDAPVVTDNSSELVLPVENYVNNRHVKAFGEYIEDRFVGFHVADDLEFADVAGEVSVSAIANGTVVQAEFVSGYGGLVRIEHSIDGEKITALYGHLDLKSVNLEIGESVVKGQELGFLGDHESAETDGERKHLHFGLYEGNQIRINGYEARENAVKSWLKSQELILENGIKVETADSEFNSATELGGDIFSLEFTVPEGHELEYIPSIQSLNIFTLSGEGSARERSSILIRYFDASDFLTLSTVKIFKSEDLLVGEGDYVARRYDIEKKAGVADFAEQPDWRNDRHIVTDFRASEGRTRYYVVAANPDLDTKVYEDFLAAIRILE
jgi:hypothetical protein